jgi:hypothetical protein
MLQTFEAEMQPNGMLHFSGFDQPKYDAIQKVLVTVISKEKTKDKENLAKTATTTGWGDLLGSLKNSPNFGGDPIAIQQRMRSEWD